MQGPCSAVCKPINLSLVEDSHKTVLWDISDVGVFLPAASRASCATALILWTIYLVAWKLESHPGCYQVREGCIGTGFSCHRITKKLSLSDFGL